MLSSASIIAENALPGTPESVWDVPVPSTNIEGFAAQFSVDHGQTVQFKVDSSGAAYQMDIYRIGYYQGDGARLVDTITPDPKLANQPAPLVNSATNSVDCSNWTVSASWNVPSTAVSGVYIADLIRSDGAGESQIIFVVRADESHSDLLFKTSDTTWEAYNSWGGTSLYGPNYPSGRALAVSYERPFNNRTQNPTDYFFAEEYPMIRYLEENGYDVSYFSSVDTAENGSLILNHKAFLSVGHDEYWSGDMVTNVEAVRDAGVSLAFFSGNTMFWKTRFTSDDAGDPYATMVCYKETLNDAVTDPDPGVWTGTWADPRFSPPEDGGRPQNQVTGTLFMINQVSSALGSADSFSLTSQYAALRFWRNTSVATLTGNQGLAVGDSVLGYEADSDVDNGFRPAGLIDLSSTTINAYAALYDYGATFGPATVTQNMTEYRAPSGALVFSAGTVQYAWGLDSDHDIQSASTDKNLQQATVNLFADMGVQPGSLMAGLVPATMSTDHTPPTSIITSPANGTVLQAGVPITITGTAKDAGGGVVAGVEVSVDGGLTWHPASGSTNWSYTWTPQTTGAVTIRSRATDDSGNIETPSAGVTLNPTPPGTATFSLWNSSTVPSTVDSGDGNAVNLGMRFESDVNGYVTAIRFYKSAANSGTHTGSLWTTTGQLLATGTFTNETASGWQTLTFNSPVAITANTPYVASYFAPNGHYSDSGSYFTSSVSNGPLHALSYGPSGFPGIYSYGAQGFPTQNFQSTNYWIDVVLTVTPPADTPPAVTSISPANNASNVATTASVTVTFSEAMNPVTLSSLSVSLRDANNNAVPATVTYNVANNTATLTPTSPLSTSSSYMVMVEGGALGVTDLAGSPLAANVTSEFVTTTLQSGGGSEQSSSSSLWNGGTTPTTIDSGDGQGVELGVRFTPMTNGFVTGVSFYKSAANTGTHTGSLWSSSGTLLATATFTGEGGSGWQNVIFSAPVAVTAGMTYVAGYHTASGHYSVTQGYFTAPYASGSLTVPTNGGVYLYGAGGFPTGVFKSSNYWVDPLFSAAGPIDTTPPTVTAFSPANGSTSVPLSASITVTFSEALSAATVNSGTVQLMNGSTAVSATVAYNAANNTATITPNSALANSTTYTILVKGGSGGVTDAAGNALTANATSSFTTVTNVVVLPTVTAFNPTSGATNVATNAALTIAFNEALTSSSVTASTIVLRDSNNTVVPATVTYNSASNTATVTPTAALANSTPYTVTVIGGASGIKDLSGDAMASSTTSSFTTAAKVVVLPTVTAFNPTSGATNVATNAALTITFSEALTTSTVTASTIVLRDSNNTVVPATVTYNSATNTATVTPTTALANSTTYTVTVTGGASGIKDLSGDAMASSTTSSFTTAAKVVVLPTVTAFNPTSGATNVATNAALTITFNEALTSSTVTASTIVLRNSNNTVVPATVTYNSANNTATVTPTAALANSTTYTVTVTGGASGIKDLSGDAMASSTTSSFSTVAVTTTSSLFSSTATPATVDSGDAKSIELGVKFTSSTSGFITGIRFYKSAANTGTHTGSLWSASGQLLATATFTGEGGSGWQQVNFSTPVAVTAGATYVASYHTTAGHYSVSQTYYTTPYASGRLSVPANGGVYLYGAGGFPTAAFKSSNYWVDVVFSSTRPADTTPPTVTSFSPANGSTNVASTASVTLTFSEALTASTVSSSTIVLRNSANTVIPATVTYNAANNTATVTPTSPLDDSTTYTVTVIGGSNGIKDLAGNALVTNATSSFTTAAAQATYTLFSSTSTPATVDSGDAKGVELGVKFTANTSGFITGIRFYKSAGNTGTHTASLWSSTGQLLATATFTSETASGWQQVNFTTPVAVTAGTTYVASYHTTVGHYSVSAGFFNAAFTNGPLSVPAGGGVYMYGSGGFPTSTFGANNYWVDPIFSTSAGFDT